MRRKRRFPDRVLIRVLEGDHWALSSALTWKDTPQGWDYWQDRHQGRVPLSEDDRGYLIRLANERGL